MNLQSTEQIYDGDIRLVKKYKSNIKNIANKHIEQFAEDYLGNQWFLYKKEGSKLGTLWVRRTNFPFAFPINSSFAELLDVNGNTENFKTLEDNVLDFAINDNFAVIVTSNKLIYFKICGCEFYNAIITGNNIVYESNDIDEQSTSGLIYKQKRILIEIITQYSFDNNIYIASYNSNGKYFTFFSDGTKIGYITVDNKLKIQYDDDLPSLTDINWPTTLDIKYAKPTPTSNYAFSMAQTFLNFAYECPSDETDTEYENYIVLLKLSIVKFLAGNNQFSEDYQVFKSVDLSPAIKPLDNLPSLLQRNIDTYTKDDRYWFPTDIDIDKVGDRFVVAGEPRHNRVFVFDLEERTSNKIGKSFLEINGPKNSINFGNKVYINDDQIIIADSAFTKDNIQYTGRVYVYNFDVSSKTVSLKGYIEIPNSGYDKSFGECIEIDAHGNIIISATEEITNVTLNNGYVLPQRGVVYIFDKDTLKIKQRLHSQYFLKNDNVISNNIIKSTKYYYEHYIGKELVRTEFNNYSEYYTPIPKFNSDILSDSELAEKDKELNIAKNAIYNNMSMYDMSYKARFPNPIPKSEFESTTPIMKPNYTAGNEVRYNVMPSNEMFGYSISANANKLLIGAPEYTSYTKVGTNIIPKKNIGFVELYEYNENTKFYEYKQNIIATATKNAANGYFGKQVEVSDKFIAIAGISSGISSVYIYGLYNIINPAKFYTQTEVNTIDFGTSIDSNGDIVVISSPKSGKIFIYQYKEKFENGYKFEQVQKIDYEKTKMTCFGNKVVFSNNNIIVSMKDYNSGEGAILRYYFYAGEYRLL